MNEEVKWQSPSMEGKWKDNKGIIHLRSIEYMRVMNMSNTPPNFTRHGIRLTLEQAEEVMPILREMIAAMKDKREEDERKSSER